MLVKHLFWRAGLDFLASYRDSRSWHVDIHDSAEDSGKSVAETSIVEDPVVDDPVVEELVVEVFQDFHSDVVEPTMKKQVNSKHLNRTKFITTNFDELIF